MTTTATVTVPTATEYVREHPAHIDTSDFADETLVPARFRDVDYTDLNGIEGLTDHDDVAGWDYARHAEDN